MRMSEANKAVVRRFVEEIWHQGHLEAIEEFIAPHYGPNPTFVSPGAKRRSPIMHDAMDNSDEARVLLSAAARASSKPTTTVTVPTASGTTTTQAAATPVTPDDYATKLGWKFQPNSPIGAVFTDPSDKLFQWSGTEMVPVPPPQACLLQGWAFDAGTGIFTDPKGQRYRWNRKAMVSILPNRPDDPRLDGWYHTIELGNGLVSRGTYDHRSVVACYGLPESLRGKTALDVGTADGFWAFELERRGAERVVAIDVARYGDFDWLPQIKAKMEGACDAPTGFRFEMARALRGSRVERKVCNIYDLSPETVGGLFDVVFCGSLLVHLQNPLKALVHIRSVTKEMAIIESPVDPELDARLPDRPVLSFGALRIETEPGEDCWYWSFSARALEKMLAYAGFIETERQAQFFIPPASSQPTVAINAYPSRVDRNPDY
jgi:tRNA (mo5U34)-methyltransferase